MSILELRPEACFRWGTCRCGVTEWLRSDNDLCYDCLGDPMSTDLTAPPALLSNSSVLAEYLSAADMVLHDDEDLQTAANIINDIRLRAKALEDLEKSVTRPILEGVERYRALFRPARDAAARARALWDGKIRALHVRRQEAIGAAQQALQQAIVVQDLPAAAEAIQALVPVARTQGLTVIETWDFEETNHAAVPTTYTVLNPVAVRAEIKRQVAVGVEPAIPGLRVFKKQIVRGG